MKIRTGFVSNSSSSSFVLVCKKNQNIEDALVSFRIPDTHPLAEVFNTTFVQIIRDNAQEFEKLDDYLKEYCYYDDIEEYINSLKLECDDRAISFFLNNPGIKILRGDFDSSSYVFMERLLANTEIEYEDDDVYFKSDGRY